MPIPKQKPGRSRQDYGTPKIFLDAVRAKLGIEGFTLDLAADETNTAAPLWINEEENSLIQDWHKIPGWLWLNPPFAKIRPWVEKACVESTLGAKIALLIPASIGSEWWKDCVHGKAHILLLNGRLTFVGEKTCYPKDCALLLYDRSRLGTYEVWDWRRER